MTQSSSRAKTDVFAKPASMDFPELAQIAPAVFFKASMAYWQVILDWQKEVQSFMGQRLRSDAKLEHAMFRKDHPVDMFKAQQRWLNLAMQQYMDESAKLVSLVSRDLAPNVDVPADKVAK